MIQIHHKPQVWSTAFLQRNSCAVYQLKHKQKNQQEREKEKVLDGTEGRSWLSWQLTCTFIFSTFSFSILRDSQLKMHCWKSNEWEMLEWSHVQFSITFSIRVVHCSSRLWKFRKKTNYLPFWGPWMYLKIEQFNWSLWECANFDISSSNRKVSGTSA